MKNSSEQKLKFWQYNTNTFWIVSKLAIAVRMGTKPFNGETMSTVIVSEKFAALKKPTAKIKLMIRLVFNDLVMAAISFATVSSSFASLLELSLEMAASVVCVLDLF